MRRLTLLVVAALVFSGGGPSLVGLASTRTSTANVELAPGTDTTPVKPVDPDGSGGAFPGDDLDPDNQGTGSRGLLTLDYVSNLTFQQQATKAGVITATATNQRAFVQISDRRGTGTGWSLLVKPTTLVGQQDQDPLTAATLTLGKAFFLSSGSNASHAPQVMTGSTQALPLNSYSLVATAQDVPGQRQGVGTWLLRLNTSTTAPTSLNVSAAAVTTAQTYAGTLSWLLTDTPQ